MVIFLKKTFLMIKGNHISASVQRLVAAVAALLVVVCAAPCAHAINFSNERLDYQIVYHWGIIWKHAANATLSISRSGNGYNAMLVGRTRSWADKVYPVRDTLKCSMAADLTPRSYQKLTHEKSYYARDEVRFTYSNGSTHGTCSRYRPGKETQRAQVVARGRAYDMLSVFYMLRNLSFGSMAVGKTFRTTIFSGKEKENLTITYRGVTTVKMRNGSQPKAYHVTFSFTQDGGTKSSDGIDAYLSIDARRIPLMLVGKLPVGEVKVYYAGA